MKKILLTIVFLYDIFCAFALQNTSSFPIDSTSMWKIDHIRNGVSDEKKHIEGDQIYNYFIKGDTLIGSSTYFRVFKTGVNYLDQPLFFENVYVGALRDADNKFYFVEKKKTKEVLLYDFNAEIDDTIQVPYDGVFEEKIVSSIDTLPDGRKLIHFNPKEPLMGCGDQYIIEGVGGSGGLLEGPVCNHFWSFDNHLVCYIQNGLLLYHDNNFQFNCDIIKKSTSENYIDSTCVWRVDKQEVTDSVADFEKLNYFICGDTLIGVNKYLKLCKTGFQLYIEENGHYTSGINDSVYMAAIREENRKLYYVEKGTETEMLLYNFNLKADDVVDGLIDNGQKVLVVDTILDNREWFYLSDNIWEKFIIEGIGTDKGLLENINENSTLVCFMKNNASVYHNGTGSECSLTFDNYNFNDCDKMKIIPENPTEGEDVKLVIRVCYTVAAKNPVYPALTTHQEITAENAINIKLNYNYDDRNNLEQQKIVIPILDTIDLGCFHTGDFLIDLNVNTTHNNSGNPYTIEYDKNLYLSFSVTQSSDIVDPFVKKGFRVYPSPANNYFVVEWNNDELRITSIDLYTIQGTKVETKAIEKYPDEKMVKIDVSNLSKGMYLVVINASNAAFTQKIILD
jgi:hypothetical protein